MGLCDHPESWALHCQKTSPEKKERITSKSVSPLTHSLSRSLSLSLPVALPDKNAKAGPLVLKIDR